MELTNANIRDEGASRRARSATQAAPIPSAPVAAGPNGPPPNPSRFLYGSSSHPSKHIQVPERRPQYRTWERADQSVRSKNRRRTLLTEC